MGQKTKPLSRYLGACVVACCLSTSAGAQEVALKNNLLYDATLTPNVGVELKLGDQSSVQAFYGFNPWKMSDRKSLRHWAVMPEYRYWTRQSFSGLFLGLHAVGGEYNVGGVKLPLGLFKPLRHNQYEGTFYGGGLTLGHAWPIARHFSLEAAIGLGFIHTKYKQYENIECGDLLADASKNYVGPTKLALNVVWLIGGKKEKPAEPIIIPTPVVPELQIYEPSYALPFFAPEVEATKVRDISGQAFLDFPVNKTVIYPEYRGNVQELAKVIETVNVVLTDDNAKISHIDIHGYASPEGSLQNNTRLAEGRAAAFKDYIEKLIQLPDDIFTVSATAEDWDGLRRAVAADTLHLANADDILRLIDDATFKNDDLREAAIKRQHPADYKRLLTTVYPALRHSDYKVTYVVRPFTAQEAAELVKTKPQQLSLNEMFMVAQLYEPGSHDYNEVFLTAVRMFPTDAVANLNAAIVMMQKADLTEAARYLEHAGQSAEAVNARGVLKAQQGSYNEAKALFQQAAAAGLNAAEQNLKELGKRLDTLAQP